MTPETHASWHPLWDRDETAPYPHPHGRRYLMPCSFLFYGGLYEYCLVDLAQARTWLLAGPAQSFLSHPLLHEAFERLMGFFTPRAQRGPLPALSYHDDCLCFVVEHYETLPDLKRGDSQQITRLIDEQRYTLGLLRRLA